MALLHPHGASSRDQKPMHPAVGLAGGFGLIVAVALIVHVLFNAMM